MKQRCVPFIIAVLVLVAFCAGCEKGPPKVAIGDIAKNPEKYYGKEVEVDGTVSNTVTIEGKMIYTLVADSGQLFVVPRRKIPPALTKVRMIVSVEKDYKIGKDPKPLVLLEKKYLHVSGKRGPALMKEQEKW